MRPLRSPRLLAALGLGTVALLAGCGDSGSGADPAAAPEAAAANTATASTAAAPAGEVGRGAVTVAYRDFRIFPDRITVKAGTKITWTNADMTRHNVVTRDGAPEAFTSTDFDKGETDSFTPTRPGTYPYVCTFHVASMQGLITVVG